MPQWNQRDGLIDLAVAAILCTGLPVCLGYGGQKRCGAIGPEAALFTEIWFAGVGAAGKDVAAHTIQDRVAGGVALRLDVLAVSTGMAFHLCGLICAHAGFEAGEIG